MTFLALVSLADFDAKLDSNRVPDSQIDDPKEDADDDTPERRKPLTAGVQSLGGLHYNIQIILPESRDPKVYDALFRSLKEHLF